MSKHKRNQRHVPSNITLTPNILRFIDESSVNHFVRQARTKLTAAGTPTSGGGVAIYMVPAKCGPVEIAVCVFFRGSSWTSTIGIRCEIEAVAPEMFNGAAPSTAQPPSLVYNPDEFEYTLVGTLNSDVARSPVGHQRELTEILSAVGKQLTHSTVNLPYAKASTVYQGRTIYIVLDRSPKPATTRSHINTIYDPAWLELFAFYKDAVDDPADQLVLGPALDAARSCVELDTQDASPGLRYTTHQGYSPELN